MPTTYTTATEAYAACNAYREAYHMTGVAALQDKADEARRQGWELNHTTSETILAPYRVTGEAFYLTAAQL
jgi:hypothetical protein